MTRLVLDGARKLGKVFEADGSWKYKVMTHLTGPQLSYWSLSQMHPDGKGGYDASKVEPHNPITMIGSDSPDYHLGPKHR
jgi:hypothetical protein